MRALLAAILISILRAKTAASLRARNDRNSWRWNRRDFADERRAYLAAGFG